MPENPGHPPHTRSFHTASQVAVRCRLCRPPSARLPLRALLEGHLRALPLLGPGPGGGGGAGGAAHALLQYLPRRLLAAGEVLWQAGRGAGRGSVCVCVCV